MEGNLCWNCKYIATCRPRVRPQCSCSGYESLGTPITHREVAHKLGVTYWTLQKRLQRGGISKIMNALELLEEDIRYEQGKCQIKFYDLSNGEKELCEIV